MNNSPLKAAALLLFTLAVPSVHAGEYVNTSIQKAADYYVWITMLSPGEKIWANLGEEDQGRLVEEAIAARQFRVAVTTSETYNSVYLEEIDEGQEGCCRRFVNIRKLDLDDMQQKFKLHGELAGFEVLKWTSPNSFKFKFKDRTFELSGLGNPRVYVEEEMQSQKPANKPLEPTR